MDREIRSMDQCQLTLETRENSPERLLVGYAAMFNVLSEEIFGLFRERIEPGAFRGTIVEDDIRALWNHDANYVLGRSRNQTLVLSEDDIGLRVVIQPVDTQWANDLITNIRRGDVTQMSFAFEVNPEDELWVQEGDSLTRIIKRCKLYDVSPVTYPAYPQTSIQARAQEIKRRMIEPELELSRRRLDLEVLG